MLMVEVSLGCMVTVVCKLIVLHQKCQIPQLTLKQFRRVTGIAENKQKSIIIQKTMGLNMYMGIFIIKPFADKFYFISLCNSHYSWHQTGGQSSRLSSTKPLLSCTEDRTMETFARNNLDVQKDKKIKQLLVNQSLLDYSQLQNTLVFFICIASTILQKILQCTLVHFSRQLMMVMCIIVNHCLARTLTCKKEKE